MRDSFVPLVLLAVITPSTLTLTDFVQSLPSGPIPVQTPSSQGPTSLPIAPLVTFIVKLAPSVVWIKVFATPEL